MQAQEMISIKAALEAEMAALRKEYGSAKRALPAGVVRLMKKLQARLAMVDAQLQVGQVGRAVGATVDDAASFYADGDGDATCGYEENVDGSNFDGNFNVQIVGGRVSVVGNGAKKQKVRKPAQQQEEAEAEVLEEAEVKAVVGHRRKPSGAAGGGNELVEYQYRVRWHDAGPEEDEWVERDELADAEDPAPALLQEYERAQGIGIAGRPYLGDRPLAGRPRPQNRNPKQGSSSATASNAAPPAAHTQKAVQQRRPAVDTSSNIKARARPQAPMKQVAGGGGDREGNWAAQQQIYSAKGVGRRTGPTAPAPAVPADSQYTAPALTVSLAASFTDDTSEFLDQSEQQLPLQPHQQGGGSEAEEGDNDRYEQVRREMEARIAQPCQL
jgi:hypothetical protein